MDGRIKRAALACLLLTTTVLTAGCSAATPKVSSEGSSPSATPHSAAPSARPSGDAGAQSGTAAAYRKWGIKPLAAPPAPPATKPVVQAAAGSGVPVISDIPTKEKIVFLTFDDGAEKDPKFVTMMRELKIPFTMFLTDAAISADYGYFKPLQGLGDPIQNHTLTHPNMRTLSASAQKAEICGQQKKLKAEYGAAPRLFRPPYGNWNEDTRAAAASCGIEKIVLWRESMQITNMQYQRGDKKLHPGDIILAHFRGPSELKGTTMTEMTANLLRHIQEQGFTVARLEDYL